MNTQRIRLLLAVALLSVMMVANNVKPTAAQTPSLTPVPLGCTFHDQYYPLGTVLHFVLPYPEPSHLYMRCELQFNQWPGGATPQWVYYGSNPS